jgi:hypothetical protein
MNKLVFWLTLLLLGCDKKDAPAQGPFFAKGADIGWLSEMEASGIKFYDASGKEDVCLNILKGLGMNAIGYHFIALSTLREPAVWGHSVT